MKTFLRHKTVRVDSMLYSKTKLTTD